MPYRDPEKRRAVWRESQARRRHSTPRQPLTALADLRRDEARRVVAVLWAELDAVREVQAAGTAERARCCALLAGTLLRAIETCDLARRLEELEALVAGGTWPGGNDHKNTN